MYSGIIDKEFISEIITKIKVLMPQCKIIGATSAVEIFEGKTYTKKCEISITVFESTKVNTLLLKNNENDFKKGKSVGQKLINKDTKAIISFISNQIDGQEFLDGINSIDKNIIVAGGVAANSELQNEVYVFTEEGIEYDGIVAAALESKTLYVSNISSFNWVPIGKEHDVTDAEGRVIKKIENVSAVEFYKKYVGIKDDNNIANVGTQFPLMIKKCEAYISRPVLGFTKDNSIILSSKIEKGEKVRIGYGDLGEVLKGTREIYNKIKEYPIESVYIYSCNSRKRFLKDLVDKELEPFDKNSSVSGFYTYGEFNHVNNKNVFYTETMTMLMLSENKNSKLQLDIK